MSSASSIGDAATARSLANSAKNTGPETNILLPVWTRSTEGELQPTAGQVTGSTDGAGDARKTATSAAVWQDWLIRGIFLLALTLVWQLLHQLLVVKSGYWSGALFPAPGQVGLWLLQGLGLTYFTGHYQPPPGLPQPNSFWEAVRQSDYPQAIGTSLWRLVQGYSLAVAIGFPLGLLVARFRLVDKTVGWLSLSLQALPSICWIPLALLWFGRLSVAAPILFVTAMGSIFATVVAVADGISHVPPILSRAGRTLGANGLRLYLQVLLPAALPGIVSGLKIGWSFAYRSLMAAELIVNAGGLGFLLQRDRDFGDADGVLATILVVLFIGVGVQALVFTPVEKHLRKLYGFS